MFGLNIPELIVLVGAAVVGCLIVIAVLSIIYFIGSGTPSPRRYTAPPRKTQYKRHQR